jgi:hypothetical protein
MAKPSATPNRLSLNANHYQSESSSIVEESNDFQKSEKINLKLTTFPH